MRRATGISIAALVFSVSPLVAQREHPAATGHHNHAMPEASPGISTLPGGINGATNPELIPDIRAYRLFFLALAVPAGAPAAERARQEALVSRARLNPADLATLFAVLADFHQQATALGIAPGATAAPRSGDPTAFEAQSDRTVNASHDALRARLTADGIVRLEAFVQSEKRRMVLFPMPAMTE